MKGGGREVAAARADPRIRGLLYWSRSPLLAVAPRGDSSVVTLGDMRFRHRAATSFTVQVVVPR